MPATVEVVALAEVLLTFAVVLVVEALTDEVLEPALVVEEVGGVLLPPPTGGQIGAPGAV